MKIILTILLMAAVPISAFAQDNTIKTVEVFSYAGAPASGTSEVDTLTIAASTSAGTFTITVAGGRTTAPITWTATDATLIADIDAKLEALSVIGVGGVTTAAGTLSSGIGTVTITFTGKNAKQDMPALSIGTNALTGGAAPTLTTTTAGVAATFKDAPAGTLIVNSLTGGFFVNTSTTAGNPTWTAPPLTSPVISGAGTSIVLSGTTGGITFGMTAATAAKQLLISGSSLDIYLTGTTGLRVSGSTVAAF